jgi:hypothetical protein
MLSAMHLGPIVAVALALASAAPAAGGPLPAGRYAITARLELPHLERYGVALTRLACLAPGSALPVPVLAAPLGTGCAARDLVVRDGRLSYAIACAGRDAPRAVASYRLVPGGFRGRVAIVLGAKNMTLTEVQAGRRLGDCPPGSSRRAGRR